MATKGARDPLFTAVFALLVTAVTCAFVLVARPRAIIPAALPPLVLDASAVRANVDADRKDAANAPKSAGIDSMYQGFLEEGRAERLGTVDLSEARNRQDLFANLAAITFEGSGADTKRQLRAYAVERFMQARKGAISDAEERDGLLGTFENQLERYGLADASGALIAPLLSVRAMYKARWNMIHGLQRTDGLTPIEIQAFEGWIALHGVNTPPEVRAKSARAFHAAGGQRGALTLGIWLYQGGALDAAGQMFREAGKRDELFVRNYALALQVDG